MILRLREKPQMDRRADLIVGRIRAVARNPPGRTAPPDYAIANPAYKKTYAT
jgi:hypothetical protein